MSIHNRPKIIEFLSDVLNLRVLGPDIELNFETYQIDLSGWRLKLSHRTPLIWIPSEFIEPNPPIALLNMIRDVIRNRNWKHSIVLVFLEGDGTELIDRVQLAEHLIIIDEQRYEQIIKNKRTYDLQRFIIEQINSLSELLPFQTNSPVVASSFFGRTSVINQVMNNSDSNFAILGIRKIGKSSVLRQLEYKLRREHDFHDVFYVDCNNITSVYNFTERLLQEWDVRSLQRLHLQSHRTFLIRFLEQRQKMHSRPVVILLDEIDALFENNHDTNADSLIHILREASNRDFCQCVIAGFRFAESELFSNASPFYNFATPIKLKEFSKREAEELIQHPFDSIGVKFNSKRQIIDRIYQETAGHPNLIQFFCKSITSQLEKSGERTITLGNIAEVVNDSELRDYLITAFMQNTTETEKLCVYVLLQNNPEMDVGDFSFTLEDIEMALGKFGKDLSPELIDKACTMLEIAGFFHRQDRQYSFISPVFVEMLNKNYDVQYLIRRILKDNAL